MFTGLDALAIKANSSTGWLQKTAATAQERGLAAGIRANDGGDRTGRHGTGQTVNDIDPAIPGLKSVNLEDGLRRCDGLGGDSMPSTRYTIRLTVFR